MEAIEIRSFYDPHVANAPKTKPKETTSIRLSEETRADYAVIEDYYRTKLAGAVAIAGAELARRIRAEQPAPKRKR